MSHIFTDDGNQWKLIPELPTKEDPGYDTFVAENAHLKKRREKKYQMSLDCAKANALPIVNPEVIPSWIIKFGEKYHQWPGTWKLIIQSTKEPGKFKHAKLIAPQQPQAEKTESELEQLHKWIASDSVYTLLRYGTKSPSSSGVDDCEDDYYSDLYNLSVELRSKSKQL